MKNKKTETILNSEFIKNNVKIIFISYLIILQLKIVNEC